MSSYLNFHKKTLTGESEECFKCRRRIKVGTECVTITSKKDNFNMFEHYYCLRCYKFPINAIEQNIKHFKRSMKGKTLEQIKKITVSKYQFMNNEEELTKKNI